MTPPTDSYRAAQLRARIRQGHIDERSAKLIAVALNDFGARIEQGLSSLPADQQGAESMASQILLEAAGRLDLMLSAATGDARGIMFELALELWENAGREAAEAVGVPLSTLGAIQAPPITMLGAFDGVGSANWRTLVRGHVQNAAQEAARIVRMAIIEQADPTELARRLRRYVQGSEPFDALFQSVPTRSGDVAKINLNRIPAHLQGAAKKMEYNARRIAFTEVHNARAEAEIQHFTVDPMVRAVRWTLAPSRGSAKVPDECDVLAHADYYGLGRGVFPLDKVPPSPHPFDRCERVPVLRGMSQMSEPKLTASRVLAYGDAPIPGAGRLTPDQAARVRQHAARAVQFGERASREIQRRRAA